jgi:hypothetical protein
MLHILTTHCKGQFERIDIVEQEQMRRFVRLDDDTGEMILPQVSIKQLARAHRNIRRRARRSRLHCSCKCQQTERVGNSLVTSNVSRR